MAFRMGPEPETDEVKLDAKPVPLLMARTLASPRGQAHTRFPWALDESGADFAFPPKRRLATWWPFMAIRCEVASTRKKLR